MKKITLAPTLFASALLLASCGTTGSTLLGGMQQAGQSVTTSSNSMVGDLVGGLLSDLISSKVPLSQSAIQGTWHYQRPDCVFESENFLAQAGGMVAANKIENQLGEQLAKFGIKPGACSFTFNTDNTYTGTIGGHTINGTYRLDTANKKMTMTYLAGLGTMTPHVAVSGNKMSLLFESDKLLSMVKGVSALSSSTTLKGVSTLLSNYQGLYVGLEMTK